MCLPTQETWFWSLSGEDPLEKEMPAHSSILAWEIPRKEWTLQATLDGVTKDLDTTEWLNWTELIICIRTPGWPSALSMSNTTLKENFCGSKSQQCFPGSSDGKESTCNAGDPGLIPGSGKSPGERNGNPLQYSCLENFMDRGAWLATVHEVAKSHTQLSH